MTNVQLLEKVQNFFGWRNGDKEAETSAKIAEQEEAIKTMQGELERLKAEEAKIPALLEEIEKLKVEADAATRICALIEDNMKSGADGVAATAEAPSAVDSVLKYANRGR